LAPSRFQVEAISQAASSVASGIQEAIILLLALYLSQIRICRSIIVEVNVTHVTLAFLSDYGCH
jgi:hypothetical protein